MPLGGGATHEQVVRVGDTVRRPPGPNPQLARDLLLRLERSGFDAAPRWLDVDEEGRDVLSWIDGETFNERGQMHPYVGDPPERISFTDDQLRAIFGLLRRYHDACGDDVVCHGDFGPWNLVWRDELPIGIIDFDSAYPGDPSEDVAYALRTFVSYGSTDADPADLARRTRLALDAYGRNFDVPAILAAEYDRVEERCRLHGWHRALAKLPAERAWLEANRDLF
jgi:Ser/Thr protein kinase RdoA (MazF antagonist)